MGSTITRQQELKVAKARLRLHAAQLDSTWKRDRQIGSLVMGGLRRRPAGLAAAGAGLLAWLLFRSQN